MSKPNSNTKKPVHRLVQLSYATPLLAERTVLLLDGDPETAAFVAKTGANVVSVCASETSPPWPETAPEEGIAHHVMPLDNMPFENGVFGAAVIPNLAELENPARVLAEVRRLLGQRGNLIVAAPNPETVAKDAPALDYYKMYELLCVDFPSVQMIGQSPFNGFAVVDLSNEDGELEVSFNSELLGNEAEEIAWFAAVCGSRPADIEPYAILQVPSTSTGGADADQLQQELDALRLELGSRGVRIESLEKSLEEELMQSEAARERAVKLAKELDNERKAITKKTLEDEFSKRSVDIDLNGALHESKKALRRAEERAQSAEEARDELIGRLREDAAELERLRNRMEKMSAKPARDPEAEKKVRLAEERARSAEAARDELVDRLREDAAELDRLRNKLDALSNQPAAPVRDPELEKKIRLAEERARSAEAARDELVDRMRADGAELERLRDRQERDSQAEDERRKSAAARASELEELRGALTEARSQLEESRRKIAALESEAAAMVAEKPAAVVPASEERSAGSAEEIALLERENQTLEQRLAVTAEQKRAAEAEASRQSAIVRDLVVRLESMGDGGVSTAPVAAEIVAESAPDTGETDARIEQMENEIAALWGAKAGEHRARVEAELELTGKVMEIERLKASLAELNILLRTRDEELKRMADDRDALRRDAAAFPASSDDAPVGGEMRIAELESDLQAAKWRNDELAGRKAELERQLADAVSEVAALRASFSQRAVDSESREEVDTLRAKLAEMEDENRRLATSFESVRRRERMLDEETERLTLRSKTLRSELDDSLSRVESLSSDLASAGAEREKMAETLHRMSDQLAEAEQRCAAMESDLRTVNEEAAVSRVKIDSSEVELKGAHEKISDLARIVDSMRDESGRLTEVMAALDRRQAEVSELREQLNVSERRLAEESESAVRLRSELDSLKASVVKESEMTRLAGADAARASGEAQALRKRLDRAASVLEERDAEIAVNLRVIASLRADAAQAYEKLRVMRAADTRAEALRRQMDSLKGETSSLSAVLSEKEAKLTKKDSVLAEKEAELGEKLVDLSDKISLLVEKESRLSEMESSLVEKESRLRGRELEVHGKEAALHDKEAEIDKKTAALEEAKAKGQALAEELNARLRESEDAAAALQEMEAKIVAVNQSKVGLSVELADAIQNGERLSVELKALKAKEEMLEAEAASVKAKLAETEALHREQEEAVRKASSLLEQSTALEQKLAEKESLINSLTDQLEERERRASKLERQNRALTEQIQEHEGDLSAWDMELKLRSARISQLEKELAEANAK